MTEPSEALRAAREAAQEAAQDVAPAVEGPSAFGAFLERLADEPALLQLLFLCVGGVLAWLVLARLSRMVRQARARAAVRDYLLGVEQALSSDLKGAATRLRRVLNEDPENAQARLLYGLVLADLGQPGEAHKHHVQLQRGFGVHSLRNDMALARNLLEVGRPAEAVEPAARAVAAHQHDREAVALLFRAQLAAGFPEDAGATGGQLARLLPPGPDRDRVRRDAARALALAARVRLGAGDLGRARELADAASAASGDLRQVVQMQARIDLLEAGEDAMWQRLRAHPPALLGGAGGAALLPAVRPGGSGQVTDLLARILPTQGYVCSTCGGEQDSPSVVCAHCGARGQARPAEPELFGELDSPSHTIDAIEENRAHVKRMLDGLADGDAAAAEELIEIGDPAVEDLLARAIQHGDQDTRFTELLQRMGAGILPAVFDCYRKRKADWLERFGKLLRRGSSAAVLGRIVQGFDREALPYFEELLGTDDRDLRKIILDYFIGLGDLAEFQKILEQFPPVEVIHRLNEAPLPVLERFLQMLEPGGFVDEVLLRDAGFYRETELFFAIAGAAHPSVLEDVLIGRGFSRSTVPALIDRVADPRLGPAAHRILDQYGSRVLSQVVSAFADLDRDQALRAELERRIVRTGAAAVGPLCDCFGSCGTPLDQELTRLFLAIGDAAVGPLCEAYQRGGVLEKFAGALVKRRTHRREMIVCGLTTIGGERAFAALRALRERETDTNLKLRLAQALHRLAERKAQPEPAEAQPAEGNEHGGEPETHGQTG